ncbi:MAG: 4'-phosphopantetheinyl transferase family protein [Thermodesulfobacteriota bacterium]
MTVLYPVICPVPRALADLPLDRRQAALSDCSREPVVLSAQKSGLPPPCVFRKDDRGAPVPEQGVWWSVSHKPDYVAGVVSAAPIGIDVEKIAPRSEALIPKVVSPAEAALFSQDRWTVFFRCWTAKEATLKSRGAGIADLDRCRIVSVFSDVRVAVCFKDAALFVEQCFFDGHVASVAGSENQPVEWTVSGGRKAPVRLPVL